MIITDVLMVLHYTVQPYPAENITMINPHVQFIGDNAAYICYIRLSQYIDK
jgi:hypothetical protein